MKLFCLKRTITQKDNYSLVILIVITQTAHCSRFCLDAIVRSGYIVESSQRARCVTMHMCNVSRGRVLQLTAWRCIAQVGRRARSKMWEFEVLMRDSGMNGVFAGYSSKKRDGW